MNTRLLAAAVITLIPLAGVAAEDTKSTTTTTTTTTTAKGDSFDALDANKDGRISMPEASADPKLVESFSTADKDGDGYLDSTEYQHSLKQPPQP